MPPLDKDIQVGLTPAAGKGLSLDATGRIPTGLLPRIVTGIVGSAGSVDAGTGWSVVQNSTGDYTVTFDVPFASLPVVLVSGSDAHGATICVETSGVSAAGFNAITFTTVPALSDRGWNFVAFATQ